MWSDEALRFIQRHIEFTYCMIRQWPDGDGCSPETVEKIGRRCCSCEDQPRNYVITTISIELCLRDQRHCLWGRLPLRLPCTDWRLCGAHGWQYLHKVGRVNATDWPPTNLVIIKHNGSWRPGITESQCRSAGAGVHDT